MSNAAFVCLFLEGPNTQKLSKKFAKNFAKNCSFPFALLYLPKQTKLKVDGSAAAAADDGKA